MDPSLRSRWHNQAVTMLRMSSVLRSGLSRGCHCEEAESRRSNLNYIKLKSFSLPSILSIRNGRIWAWIWSSRCLFRLHPFVFTRGRLLVAPLLPRNDNSWINKIPELIIYLICSSRSASSCGGMGSDQIAALPCVHIPLSRWFVIWIWILHYVQDHKSET